MVTSSKWNAAKVQRVQEPAEVVNRERERVGRVLKAQGKAGEVWM
jgi:hypothetical protein